MKKEQIKCHPYLVNCLKLISFNVSYKCFSYSVRYLIPVLRYFELGVGVCLDHQYGYSFYSLGCFLQVKDNGKTYLTVRVPLYVYYLYTTAPVGWGSLQHHTEMEFSFYYSNILWQTGLESEGKIAGDLQVLKVLVGRDGRLVIDLKTQTKFRGRPTFDYNVFHLVNLFICGLDGL